VSSAHEHCATVLVAVSTKNPTSHLNIVKGAAVVTLVNMARDKHTHTLVYTTRTCPKNRNPTKLQDT